MIVEAGPGGVVHDYVPFYFTSKNPMLLSLLYSKNIDQQFIVFMAISIDKIMNSNVVFTLMHLQIQLFLLIFMMIQMI